MATTNLEADELANGQVNYLLANETFDVFDRSIAGRLTIDFASDANYTLSTTVGSEEWRDKFMTFTDTGVVLTTGRDVIFPAKKGPEYIIKNSTAQTLTLKISGQTGVTIATTVTGRYYYDGTDIVAAP